MTDMSDFAAKLLAGVKAREDAMTPEERAARDALHAKQAAEAAEATRMQPFVWSGISKRLHHDDIAKIADGTQYETASLKVVQKWIAEARKAPDERLSWWGPWVWLGGDRGIGKTMAAAWAFNEMKHLSGKYITFLELCRIAKQRESFKKGEAEEADEEFRSIIGHQLFVLDEVGQEPEEFKSIAKTTLHDVVDIRRHLRGLTLVLSNKSGDTIRGRFKDDWYDSRTESRLRQLLARDRNGKGLHDIKGEDLRGDPI